MPAKVVMLNSATPIKIYKRKGAKSIRLSIVGDGSVRVTQPRWLPYKAGVEFALRKRRWILANKKDTQPYTDGQQVGKSFQLKLESNQTTAQVRSRIQGHTIIVKVPSHLTMASEEVQKCARRAIMRALKIDTEDILLPRLRLLAHEHGFSYKGASVRQLKSRWGSCTQHKQILLSSYLVQLPWPLIDYVLLHELQHTTVLRHGEPFWSALSEHVDDLKNLRSEIKKYQAQII